MAVGTLVSIIVLGALFKRLVVDPMIRHGVLPLVIATIGLAILMKEAVREFYGADAQPFPPLAAAYLSSQYRMALPLLILIVVILFRPQGLLGRIEERTV